MSFTGTRIGPNGMITWNQPKPGVKWPVTGNVSRTFVSKPGNEYSRGKLANFKNVLVRSAQSLIAEKKNKHQTIGRSYGEEKMPWNTPSKRKNRRGKKSRKTRKVSRR